MAKWRQRAAHLRSQLKALRRRAPRDPGLLHVVVVNLDHDKGGDRRYIWLVLWAMLRLIARRGGVGVVCLVETKKGRENVRMIGVGVRLRGRHMIPVGDVGIHRDVEVAYIRLGRRRRKVWLTTGHGPHRKTIATREDPTGQRGQDSYYVALRDDVLDDFDTSLFVGDLNNDPADVAAIVGGEPFGPDGDVMGGVFRGLVLVHQWSTSIGRPRFTGHREAWATFRPTSWTTRTPPTT